MLALAVFEVGSLVCALAPSSTPFIIGRAVAGSGAGGVLSGSYVITARTVPMKIRPAYIAAVSMMFSIGAIVAPLIGGALTEHVTWRWCFYINLPVGMPVLVGIAMFFRLPTGSHHSHAKSSTPSKLVSLDLLGAILLLGAAAMLLLAMQYAADGIPWRSPLVAGLLAGAAVTTAVFAFWLTIRGDQALIPPRILKQMTVLTSTIANVAMYAAPVIYIYFLPIYFQAIKGKSIVGSAVDLLPLIVACSVFSIVAGVLVTKTRYFTPPAIVGTALAVIGAGLFTTIQASTPTAPWAGFEIVSGVGLGLALQQGFFGVQAVLPPEDIPVGTSLMTIAQSLGGALGVSIGNVVLLCKLRGAGDHLERTVGLNIEKTIHAGATGFQSFVTGDALNLLLDVYNDALVWVLVMATVLAGVAFVASCFMEMRPTVVRTKEECGKGQDGA